MNKFVAKFKDIIKGVLTGFDRIVFKGTIMPLAHTKGAMRFCVAHGIHNKDFKSWAMGQTEQIVQSAEEYSREQCGHGITPILFSKTRKEALAHKRQQELRIQSGLIGVWWAMESCWSYRAKYSAQAGYPQLRRDCMKCKHLYFYLDHPLYGFMNIRLQTWFPYHIQIALNGREWLRRSLERAGRDFLARGNKFVYIDDYDRAQRLLDRQLDTRWDHMLDGFLADVFPDKEAILGPGLSYYWTLWQSEWATDLIYPSPKDIVPIAESLMRHAFATGTSDRILRYLDHPLKKDGTPRADLSQEVASRLRDGFHEGLRVRHWVGGNSVKCYNELNVLRVEMTMNQPDRFRAHRHTQGQSESESKRLLPLRKGVADVVVRTQVSQDVNNRFMDNLATAQCETPVRALLDEIVKSSTKEGRRVRALDPTGKDRALLQALHDPVFCISGLSNHDLREKLRDKTGYCMTEKQLSAKMSRHLRLLRDHGFIRKMPRQKRYLITAKGREITTALAALLAASTKQLMDIAA